MKLTQKSQQMLNKLIKYYPIECDSQKQNNNNHVQHKKPSQHLHDYRKERQIYEKTTDQKLQNMLFFKQEGNNHYKNGRYQQASYCYQKVIIYGDYTFPDKEEDNVKMGELLQQANCNLALCLIKLNQWDKIKVYLSQTIKGSNVSMKAKGMYWLVKYHIKQNSFEQASKVIKDLKDLGEQHIKMYQQLQKELNTEISKDQDQKRKLFSNMFKE